MRGLSGRRLRQRAWRAGLCAVLGLGLLAARPAAAAEVQIRDQRGQWLRLAQPPQRIVSLLPSLTEAVCALGACARLVATDRYSNWPASVAAVPKVGGLEDAQIERIVALKPDVVLAARSSRAIDRLEALGQRVVVLEATTHAEVQATLATLATLLGQPEQGMQLWRDIEAQLQQAAARVPATVRGQKVYVEVDAAPYAAGSASFVGETLTRLGMNNIVPAALGPFPKLNPEFVVRAQPDLVMAVDRNAAEMIRRPGWASLRALQQGRVCGFPSARYDILVRPGPRLGEAALVLADCLAGLGAATAGPAGATAVSGGTSHDGAATPAARGARR